MKNQAPIPYAPPTITTYGTVREFTRGTGGTTQADVLPCTPGSFRSNKPSGVTCKTAG